MNIADNRPSCTACKHYHITHDARFRYGCRAFGFKSKRQPILEVQDASGEPCHSFQKRGSSLEPSSK